MRVVARLQTLRHITNDILFYSHRAKVRRASRMGAFPELRRRKVDFIFRVEVEHRSHEHRTRPVLRGEIYEHTGNSAGTLYSQAA